MYVQNYTFVCVAAGIKCTQHRLRMLQLADKFVRRFVRPTGTRPTSAIYYDKARVKFHS